MDKDIKLYMASVILVGITVILVIINTILTMIGVITSECIIWEIALIPGVIGDIIGIYNIAYMINNARKKDRK